MLMNQLHHSWTIGETLDTTTLIIIRSVWSRVVQILSAVKIARLQGASQLLAESKFYRQMWRIYWYPNSSTLGYLPQENFPLKSSPLNKSNLNQQHPKHLSYVCKCCSHDWNILIAKLWYNNPQIQLVRGKEQRSLFANFYLL